MFLAFLDPSPSATKHAQKLGISPSTWTSCGYASLLNALSHSFAFSHFLALIASILWHIMIFVMRLKDLVVLVVSVSILLKSNLLVCIGLK